MIPKRPYLLRALHDWIVDSELTPYLLVGVDSEAVQVPSEYVSDGKIVLNISALAVRDLMFEDDSVSFSGRFGGRPFPIYVPMANVLAIYAKESGEGMMFEPEYDDRPDPDPGPSPGSDPTPGPDGEPPTPEPRPGGGSHLKVVK